MKAVGLFKDQVAIVTGAASGLGLAIATKLHEEGAAVALIDLNEKCRARNTPRRGSPSMRWLRR